MSGVEIHAHAVATLLCGGFVRDAAPWMNLATLCLLPAFVLPLVTTWRLRNGVLIAASSMSGYFVFNVWLFVDHRIWLHVVAPCAATLLTTLGTLLVRDLTQEREKRRFRWLLHRYVSRQIAEYVIANPDKCLLGGERVTASVLFSDIRGFTTISERLAPEQVVSLLNEYFQLMTDIVFRHGGTVEKYLGDGMMALFGVPVPHPDHARRAVAAAIDMQDALLNLQTQREAEGLPLLDVGIGINTGEMLAGNIGANERLDFTVFGDAVNLASRLEGLNVEMGSTILITESTYALVKDDLHVWGPLRARVRGRKEEVTLYGVFGWKETGSRKNRAADGLPRGAGSAAE